MTRRLLLVVLLAAIVGCVRRIELAPPPDGAFGPDGGAAPDARDSTDASPLPDALADDAAGPDAS